MNISIWVSDELYSGIEEARTLLKAREKRQIDRSQFVRDALREKLKELGVTLPDDAILPPDRTGKGGRKKRDAEIESMPPEPARNIVKYSDHSDEDTMLVAEDPPRFSVPTAALAAAGTGIECFDDLPFDENDLTETDCSYPKARAVIIRGDSMEPDYPAGTRVIVTPGIGPDNGSLVVANLKKGGIVFKRLYLPKGAPLMDSCEDGPSQGDTTPIELRSLNPKYAPKRYTRRDFYWIYPARPAINPRGRT